MVIKFSLYKKMNCTGGCAGAGLFLHVLAAVPGDRDDPGARGQVAGARPGLQVGLQLRHGQLVHEPRDLRVEEPGLQVRLPGAAGLLPAEG